MPAPEPSFRFPRRGRPESPRHRHVTQKMRSRHCAALGRNDTCRGLSRETFVVHASACLKLANFTGVPESPQNGCWLSEPGVSRIIRGTAPRKRGTVIPGKCGVTRGYDEKPLRFYHPRFHHFATTSPICSRSVCKRPKPGIHLPSVCAHAGWSVHKGNVQTQYFTRRTPRKSIGFLHSD